MLSQNAKEDAMQYLSKDEQNDFEALWEEAHQTDFYARNSIGEDGVKAYLKLVALRKVAQNCPVCCDAAGLDS